MNHDLIKKLESLHPTEGEWKCDLYDKNDDNTLINLAPTMRLEILKMAKEIEFLNERIEGLLKDRKDKSPF